MLNQHTHTGKPFNFLVTNKWRNREVIGQLRPDLPLLMLVSGKVSIHS